MAAEWELVYWPGMAGRGEFVRLMFEEAGVTYEDVGETQGVQAVLEYIQGKNQEGGGIPIYAVPVIIKDQFRMCQMPAILQYLGKKYSMAPDSLEEDARAMQITLGVSDFIEEGHNAFHPYERSGTYDSQKEMAADFIKRFLEKRFLKHLLYLENCLKYNNDGKGFFVGDKLSYADIAVFNGLRVSDSQFPAEYAAADIPLLKAFRDRIASRPKIAEYLKSDRVKPFCGNSMM
ncbi:PREDICTED: glutathione S-transferase-like isoform X2 [Amphimedon queenslandica]|uniref:Glutathione transferase n=1 Tax=Amphimedon queenslandica TaxID=400682 RepID=A0A1X7VQ02_AMPQE|nr:PREDICTED: glutathione S-transferase-like isoform X2 [Amphimedon queenslandica]|eukprot:XP_019858949.1 PREDICTED: glutathione S-transferase-like isoform X2 [Amphimedon queenslandica]